MVSQDKLIKQGISYTDALFDEVSKRLEQGVRASDTLEAFLDKYHKAFPENGNPLITLGYDKQLINLILQETNNHKFSRPAQKELVRVTIENKVGELIVDVGDDIMESVRDIVKDGYDNNLSQDEIAANITSKVDGIKGRRARAIARTEIARTATISDYVINKERGATHFYVECRNTACPVCKKAWHSKWTEENDSNFNPRDKSAGGKGWIGDNVFSMNDTGMLPPKHPNCRCVAYFVSDNQIPSDTVLVKDTTGGAATTSKTEPTGTIESLSTKLLDGDFKRYVETNEFGREMEVYKFNNIELAFETDGTGISFEELKQHIDSLPEKLQSTNAKRIEILSTTPTKKEYNGSAAGLYWSGKQLLQVFNTKGKSKEYVLNVFNHEYSHSIDLDSKGLNHYSNPEVYEKYVLQDNIHINDDELRYTFSTEYGGRSYLRDKNLGNDAHVFVEDFADSGAKYLNPYTHEDFCKKFPNRAKYFEKIYGKPDFKDTQFTTSGGVATEHEFTSNYHLELLEQKYEDQMNEIQSQIDELQELRFKYSDNADNASSDEEEEMWRSKAREVRVERKRLRKVYEELDEERFKVFQRKFGKH